jgi:hypothetical protein
METSVRSFNAQISALLFMLILSVRTTIYRELNETSLVRTSINRELNKSLQWRHQSVLSTLKFQLCFSFHLSLRTITYREISKSLFFRDISQLCPFCQICSNFIWASHWDHGIRTFQRIISNILANTNTNTALARESGLRGIVWWRK